MRKNGYDLVTDGEQVHIEGLPGGELTHAWALQTMVGDLPQLNLEVINFWDWPRQLSTDPRGNMHFSTFSVMSRKWNGKTYDVLEENAQRVRVRYFVDPKTSLIMKTEQYPLGSTVPSAITSIDKLELNVPVDKKQFVVAAVARKKK